MKLRGFVACLAMALSAGCALAPKLQAPHLQVVDVDLLRGDLLRQELRVRMLVQNPDNRELAVRSVTYEMRVAGEDFAHGESLRDFTVPAHGQLEFEVSATANAAATALRLLGSHRKLDSIDYEITGEARLASRFIGSVPFHHKGEFKLR